MEATAHLPLSPVLMLYMQAGAVVALIQELLDLAEQAVEAQLQLAASEHLVQSVLEGVEVVVVLLRAETAVPV
jgi:hypothetical protein